MPELTQEILKEILQYNPDTGIFTWKKKPANNIHVGDVAGGVDKGYIRIRIQGRMYRAHRLAWLFSHGVFPPDQIDHINHHKNDNRIINLREATPTENQHNASLHKNNTSGVNGIGWSKGSKKWKVQIKVAGKDIHLGYYDDKDDAITARQAGNLKYGFHQNHGR
ncbi:MAG: HNH endonuclease [Mariprofundaceae bacterium]|nr:HNH endonuclease [Mariprofundaceae bacterium]